MQRNSSGGSTRWRASSITPVKPRPYEQQCPSNIVECYKFNDFFDNVECCFDIVAVFGNNVAGFGNNVERTCSICFDFVERTKFYDTRST